MGNQSCCQANKDENTEITFPQRANEAEELSSPDKGTIKYRNQQVGHNSEDKKDLTPMEHPNRANMNDLAMNS